MTIKIKDFLHPGINQSTLNYATKKSLTITAFIAYWVALNKPDCMLGPIPLYDVKYYDVAESQDILKFRSIGAQFLAHQDGGTFATRIDFRIPTELAYLLPLIHFLYMIGRDVAGYMPSITSISKVLKPTELNLIDRENIAIEGNRIGKSNFEWKKSEYHATFPVFSKDFFLFNMYIETYSYNYNVVNGIDYLQCSVLLRKFTKPFNLHINNIVDPKREVSTKDVSPGKVIKTVACGANARNRKGATVLPIIVDSKSVGKYAQVSSINYPDNYEIVDTVLSLLATSTMSWNTKIDSLQTQSIFGRVTSKPSTIISAVAIGIVAASVAKATR